jgi:two-component system NtrC family sensor kinase
VDPHLEILRTVAATISRSLDVDEVLRTALDALTHVTGHEISSVHLLAAEGGHLELRGDRGLSGPLREANRRLPLGQGLIGSVVASGTMRALGNAAESADLLPAARSAVREDHIRGFVCVPIGGGGRILGALSLGRRTTEPFGEAEIALVQATADQIGIALDHARLYAETRRQLEELTRTQAQLIHAEKLSAVGELASGLAHEINNPLTTILGHAHLLLEESDLGSPLRDRLSIIAEETARAARIVQNLLLFARPYPLERRPCSLGEQVGRVLALTEFQLQRDGVRVVTELSDCPPMWADENQVQQVLLNLVQNAQQAMAAHAGPRVVTIRTRPAGDMVAVEVLDSGPGIPADALPRVFDPFFTTKAPGQGSGLGLSVSYGIVREHGGRIRAENRPEGGAVFTVELPGVPAR